MKKSDSQVKEYGSQFWLRRVVNCARCLIDRELASATETTKEPIEWVSPLEPDFKEYHDQEFIDKLGISLKKVPLAEFWPKGGPNWDALARTSSRKVFLVEAKAHISELNSTPSGASAKPMERIAARLKETQAFLNATPHVDWTRTFYQYTNRIAHLYLLRELNGIDAYLVNVYFLNDTRMKGPAKIEEWKGALTLLKTHLGITRTKLSPFMKDIFIDVRGIRNGSSAAPNRALN